MSDIGTATARPPDSRSGAPEAPGHRAVTRRRGLPGGRAVAGALLITAAAVGVFAAYLDATGAPDTAWVVAAADIPPGTLIDAALLAAVPLELPPAQAARAFPSVGEVVGSLAVGPMQAGDLVSRSSVLTASTVPGTSTYTFALPATQALGGAIVAGDRVDVIATAGGETAYVAEAVQVLSVRQDSAGRVVVTVAIEPRELVLAIVNAIDTATVHLTRPTAIDPAGG